MRFRKALTFLNLAAGLVFVLSAWAQQKIVAPTLRLARADVAASLPRHGSVKPPLRHADLKVNATTPGITPTKRVAQSLGFQRLCGFSGVPSMFDSLEVKVLYPT